jgi:AraC-like DNA-binding protein
MPQIREGFKGQRVITVSSEILEKCDNHPILKNLYIRKIGFFPSVKYHYVNKDKGVNYNILMYCVSGEGWYTIGEKYYKVKENEFVILPQDIPHSFGADKKNPWTLYFIHFMGKMSSNFYMMPVVPRQILPGNNSRLEDRINLFEEIYENLELSHQIDHYCYASNCLFHFLASFKYLDQFRHVRSHIDTEQRFSEKVIYFMRENLHTNLTLDQLASHFGFSPSHFSVLFQEETKQSPIKYYITLKIQKACEYLELSNIKISDIYPKLGFDDAAYFSRIFGKIIGVSPSKYRERER